MHDPERLLQLMEDIKNMATLLGVTTETSPLYEGMSKVGVPIARMLIPLVEKYKVRKTGCYSCPIGYHVFMEVPEIGAGEIAYVQFFYCWLQVGVKGESDEAGFLAKQLADMYRINTYELLQLIPFILVLYDMKVLGEAETGTIFKIPRKRIHKDIDKENSL